MDLVGDHPPALRSRANHQDLPQSPLDSHVAYLIEGEVKKWSLLLSQKPGTLNQDEPSVRKEERAIPGDRLLDGGAATKQDGFVGPEQLDVLQRQCPLDVNEKGICRSWLLLFDKLVRTNERADDSHLRHALGRDNGIPLG